MFLLFSVLFGCLMFSSSTFVVAHRWTAAKVRQIPQTARVRNNQSIIFEGVKSAACPISLCQNNSFLKIREQCE